MQVDSGVRVRGLDHSVVPLSPRRPAVHEVAARCQFDRNADAGAQERGRSLDQLIVEDPHDAHDVAALSS
jgi:hypothetical protein